jgi:hypothetical protein
VDRISVFHQCPEFNIDQFQQPETDRGSLLDQCQKNDVVTVTPAAVHTNGFSHMVRKLVHEGLFTSQIRALYNPEASGEATKRALTWVIGSRISQVTYKAPTWSVACT